jgi:hypothetical protein
LGIPEYPWEIVGIDYVTDLLESGIDGYTTVFIMVCHLAEMAHFVPYMSQGDHCGGINGFVY